MRSDTFPRKATQSRTGCSLPGVVVQIHMASCREVLVAARVLQSTPPKASTPPHSPSSALPSKQGFAPSGSAPPTRPRFPSTTLPPSRLCLRVLLCVVDRLACALLSTAFMFGRAAVWILLFVVTNSTAPSALTLFPGVALRHIASSY